MTRNEENCSILARYRAGDKRALTELCEKNKNLVISAARGVFVDGMEFEDIVSEGWIGFLRAVDEFETDNNFGFFAWLKIRQHLFGLARASGVQARSMPGQVVELDAKDDALTVDPTADESLTCRDIREALAALTTTERQVIDALYFEGESQVSAAERFGLSRQRVQRIEAGALATLREELSE